MREFWRGLLTLSLLAGMLALSPSNPVTADDSVVSTCDEASFDAALATALSGGGTITFSCSGTITFTSQKVITAPNVVVIDGGGQIAFDGNDATRLFVVNGNATMEVHNLELNNGSGDGGAVRIRSGATLRVVNSSFDSNGGGFEGGALDNDGGVIEVVDSTFSSNVADNGGAIDNDPGTLTVTNSTFRNNSADFGAVIYNDDSLTIVASTISGNNAGSSGGAVTNSRSGTLTIAASTISGNSANSVGGGIRNFGSTTIIASSIVALNTAPTGANCNNFDGSIISQGSNLSDDDSCNFTASDDIENSANVDLGPLQNNGGPTKTILPSGTSDAVDNADCSLSTSADQRDISRPQGATCDIGAVERVLGATYTLCASYYTGAVTSPLSGECRNGTVEVTPFDKTFCIDVYTGKLLYQFGRPCNPPRVGHTMPDDGDLLTCVSLYTGANRWVTSHSQCSAYELPNTIPATP